MAVDTTKHLKLRIYTPINCRTRSVFGLLRCIISIRGYRVAYIKKKKSNKSLNENSLSGYFHCSVSQPNPAEAVTNCEVMIKFNNISHSPGNATREQTKESIC